MQMNQKDFDTILLRQQQERGALQALMHAPSEEHKNRWANLCKDNLLYIHRYVKENSWPNAKISSAEVENAAFLMAQHGDTNRLLGNQWQAEAAHLQSDILQSMKINDAARGYVAFLTDRICFNQAKPQIYGCVPVKNYPISDAETLENRRKSMGLFESREDYLDRLEKGDKVPFREIYVPHDKPLSQRSAQKTLPLDNIALVGGAIALGFMSFGLPLLGAIFLACSAVVSPTIQRQTNFLIEKITGGTPLSVHSTALETRTLTPLNQRQPIDFSNNLSHPAHLAEQRGYSFVKAHENAANKSTAIER